MTKKEQKLKKQLQKKLLERNEQKNKSIEGLKNLTLSERGKVKFIVVEGKDGSGKSTFVKDIIKLLEEAGINSIDATGTARYLSFSEPRGTTEESQALYSNILNGVGDINYNLTLSRIINQEAIAKALDKNYFVIVDRYIMSTLAYQGKTVDNMNAIMHDSVDVYNFIMPDAYIYVDVDYETASERLGTRDDNNSLDFKSEEEFNSINYDDAIEVIKKGTSSKVFNVNAKNISDESQREYYNMSEFIQIIKQLEELDK